MIASIFSDEVSDNIEQQVAFCQKNKIKYIEMRSIDNKNILEFEINIIKKIAKKLKSNGIKVNALGTAIGKKDFDFRNKDEKMLRKAIEVAKILECTRIRIFSYYLSDNKHEVFQWIKQMSDIARRENIILCIENEKNTNFQTIEDGFRLIAHLKKQASFVFDPANFVQCGEDSLIAYDKLEEYISYMHLKDVNKEGLNVLIGDGEANIMNILERYLKKDRENKGITLEPHLAKFRYLEFIDDINNFKKRDDNAMLMKKTIERVKQISNLEIFP